MWMMPLHLHVKQKSDYDYDDDDVLVTSLDQTASPPRRICIHSQQFSSILAILPYNRHFDDHISCKIKKMHAIDGDRTLDLRFIGNKKYTHDLAD